MSLRYTGAARHDCVGYVWLDGGDSESPELGISELGEGASVSPGDHDNKGIPVPLHYYHHTDPSQAVYCHVSETNMVM